MACALALVSGCGESPSPAVTESEHSAEAAAGEPSTLATDGGVRQVAHTEAATGRYDKVDKPKFDPVEINGKYFEGWPKPKLALVISGRQDGYLEPCGCAGLDQQKGGISRRHSLIRQLEADGWPVAAVDVGGLVNRFGRQAEIKFAISAEALKKMGYSAVGFGPDDLRLSAGEIVAAVAGADPKDSIFVSANVSLFDLTPKTRIVEAGGLKLGITSVLGQAYQQQVNNDEVVMQPPDEALGKVVGQLQDCDVRILLAHATVDETKALAKKFPQFDIVVTSDGRDVPPQQPEKIEGTKARLIEIAPKAMYVIVAGLYDDPNEPVRFQRVALDSRFPESADMKALMTTYQDQLRELGWRDLGLKTMPHPRARPGDKLSGQFAGASSCKECHPTTFAIWSKTPHVHATETLAKLDPPRQYDAECISCHSTGWNPQEFFAYTGGFDSLEKTPLLAGNQCENCHGPAAAHVAAERGRNRAKKEAEREPLKLTAGLALENVCIKCHDHDNSPEFNAKSFETHYWPKVEHKGKR
ncbi:MAG: multiheme c-type cytochrome [Pirellulales bacterium]